MNRSFYALLTLPLLAACGGLDDSRFQTGSSTVASSSDFLTLHVVDADSGVIGSMDADGNETGRLEIGGEPTRIARLGDKYLVTQRTERTVAVLSETSDGLQFDEQILVGAEPVGVVASEDGAFAYVAASLSGTVSEIDAETLEVTRSWAIPGEPRWVALHPSGNALFVGAPYGDEFHRVDLGSEEVTAISFPTVNAQALADGTEFALSPRMTGDLAISPNGKAIAMPVLYVENTTPVPPPNSVFDDFGGSDGYAANNGQDGGRFNGTVVVMDLDDNGDLTVDEPGVLALNGFTFNDDVGSVSIGGYAASLTWDTANENIFATMEGASAVLRVQVYERERYDNTSGGVGIGITSPGMAPTPMEDEFFEGEFFGVTGATILPDQLMRHHTDTITTEAGPRGVAMLDGDQVFVNSFLTRTLQKLPVADLPVRNQYGETDEDTDVGGGGATTVDVMVRSSDGMFEGGDVGFSAGSATELAPDSLTNAVRMGRELFYSTTDARMSAHGAPISCATCHIDGRTDGVTWTFFDLDGEILTLQTPTLAGDISATAPVTWLSGVASVAEEAMITSQGRMGGQGLSESEADLVASYIDWSRAPDTANAGSDADAVVRGEAIFNSDETECADCHSGDQFTDNDTYDMYGLTSVRTRSLKGISASAPYLHDGSSPTLKSLIERSRDGSMGDTSSLSDGQMDDLVAYLRSI